MNPLLDFPTPAGSSVSIHDASSRYADQCELGRGACGVVMAARDQHLERDVAIKRMTDAGQTDQLRQRFLHEAKLTAGLQHPGIVPIHEAGIRGDGNPYYVMKLLRGETLARRIARHRSSSASLQAVDYPLLERFIDVCDAVAFAHRQGIIHRDLKPANVMLGDCGETVVVDWGLARSVREMPSGSLDPLEEAATVPAGAAVADRAEATRQGTVAGTPGYMSPEQARGDVAGLSPATDVFALGVMLFELLTGRTPFPPADGIAGLLRMTIEGRWLTPRDAARNVPRPLASICRKAMAFKPAERYRDASELAAEVRRYLADEPVMAHQESWWEPLARWCRRNSRTAMVSLAALVLLALISTVSAVTVHRAHLDQQRSHAETRAAWKAEQRARREAEVAHAEALERWSLARAAADTWLVDLGQALTPDKFSAGEESPLAHELLSRAEQTYQQLLQSAIRGTASPHEWVEQVHWIEQVHCLTQLGEIRRLQGRPEAAEHSFEQALAVLSQRTDRETAGRAFLLATLRARLGLATLALENGSGETIEKRRQPLQQACQSLLVSDAITPQHAATELALARGLLVLAKISNRQGDHDTARERLAAARSLVERTLRSASDAEPGIELRDEPPPSRLTEEHLLDEIRAEEAAP